MRLTLAPDCDYRLAEQRVMEVVSAVFARYRDSIQRDYHNVEGALSISFESPRPFSRLQLSEAGIEGVVRATRCRSKPPRRQSRKFPAA